MGIYVKYFLFCRTIRMISLTLSREKTRDSIEYRHSILIRIKMLNLEYNLILPTEFPASDSSKRLCEMNSCVYQSHKESFYPEKIISISCSKDTYFFRSSEISHIKADGHSVDLHLFQKPVVPIFNAMKYFEENMEPPFYRIHKSFMVNSLAIYRINWVKRHIWIHELNTPLPYSIKYIENVRNIEFWLKNRRLST